MPDALEVNRGYVVIGVLVILANLLVLITLLSSAKLISKYQMLIALAFADIIAGCGTLSAGYGRLIIYSQVPVRNDTTIADCMRAPWIPLMDFGGKWPALIVLLIGCERSLAVFQPLFYHAKFKNKHRIIAIIASAASAIGMLLCAYGNQLVFGDMTKITTPICTILQTFGAIFNDVYRGVIVFGNLGGFCFSLVAALSARHQSKAAGARGIQMRKEAKRTNLLLAVSTFSVILATLPNLLFLASGHGLFVFPNNTDYINSIVFNTSSLINFFLYLIKKDYRTRFIWLITAGRFFGCLNEASVVPTMNTLQIRSRQN